MRLLKEDVSDPARACEINDFFAIPRPEVCLKALDELLSGGKKKKGAVIKLHLENFKTFNDTFGFQFGELLIMEIARFLCGISNADVYRSAGVEYIVILENRYRHEVQRVLTGITNRFEDSWHINSLDCMCAVNVGVAYYPGYAGTSAEMMEHLSHAVSYSALSGQNRSVAYDENLRQNIHRKNSIALQIPKAMESGALEIRYRPSYHTGSKQFMRADCYMRMFSEEFGIIQAAEFVPIVEESGQINAVSQYVIKKACRMISELIEENKEFETIAVPISPIQFLQERFVDDVAAIIEEMGVPADRLAFEVTESVSLSAFTSAQMRMSDLSEMGIEIVLADFGTGCSGINNILTIPVDVLKLDRLLIWQLENDTRGAYLVEGLIHIAKNIGLKLIAEGVETDNQVMLLEKFGCEYEQGFYYSPTMTFSELKDAFQTRG